MCIQKTFHKHFMGPVADGLPSFINTGLRVQGEALLFLGGAGIWGGSADPLCYKVGMEDTTAPQKIAKMSHPLANFSRQGATGVERRLSDPSHLRSITPLCRLPSTECLSSGLISLAREKF